MQIVYRKNSTFCIDETKIKEQFRTSSVINGLYAAIYEEFMGAIHNHKYSSLSSLEKFKKLNEFAYEWLNQRGFI
jgi:hypothetical protein